MPSIPAPQITTIPIATTHTLTAMGMAKMSARNRLFHPGPAIHTGQLHKRGVIMRYLITGGAGFIGSHLSEALIARGEEVFVLDDLSTGSVENIRHLKDSQRFHYIFHSIMNKHLLAELVDECDVIFHLAAAVGVRLIVESPVRTIETNVHGTQNVLDAASKKKKRVLPPPN